MPNGIERDGEIRMAKVLMVRLAGKSGLLDEDGGEEEHFEHKALARALPILDGQAEKAGLPPLSGFLSEDPENVHDLVDDEAEAEELLAKLPPLRWSQPQDALPTVKALIKRLEGQPVAGIKNADKIVEELGDLQTILEFGVAKEAKFRLFNDF